VSAVSVEHSQENGIAVDGGSASIYQCTFIGNAERSSWNRTNNALEGVLKCLNVRSMRVDGCRFLQFDSGNVKRACVISGADGVAQIGWCHIVGEYTGSEVQPQGIVVTGGGTGPVAIMPSRFATTTALANPIAVESGARDCVIFPQYNTGSGAIEMGGPSAPELVFGSPQVRGAVAQLSGTLIPAAADDLAFGLRAGMLAYNTALNAVRVYTGAEWKSIAI